MLLFALALGVSTLVGLALRARAPEARVAIRGVDDAVELRRGGRLLVVNGDIRAQRLIDPAGSVVRLDRPGAACTIRFERRGTFTLDAYGDRCLVPWLDAAPRHATIEVVVR